MEKMRFEAEEKTAGGIVLPDSAREQPQEAKVISVGAGKRLEDGSVKPLEVRVGQRVLYGKYSGTDVTVDQEEYLILREEDVLAIVQS